MTYFTSWDANVFLCLVTLGVPEDVVKVVVRISKKTHEEFSLGEAVSYWTNNSPSLVGRRLFQLSDTLEFPQKRSIVFQRRLNLTKEFKQEWRLRSIEERKAKVIEWCKFGNEADQLRHQHRLKVNNPPVCRRYKYVKNLWQSWGAGASSYYFVGWDRRVNTSQWYEGIHPGRFFLFYRENEIVQERNKGAPKGPCEDGPVLLRPLKWPVLLHTGVCGCPRTPIFDIGPYEQLIEDLRCIDGPGLGESGSKVEHLDDLFSK
jgi:hypothetical protein